VGSGALLLGSSHRRPPCPRLAHGLPTRTARLLGGHGSWLTRERLVRSHERGRRGSPCLHPRLVIPGKATTSEQGILLWVFFTGSVADAIGVVRTHMDGFVQCSSSD